MRHALIRRALLCAVALGAVAAQAGTAGAGQGGTVVVCPGRYREDVQILTKRVIMRAGRARSSTRGPRLSTDTRTLRRTTAC